MKIKLVKFSQLSGNKASIYGVWFEKEQKTSYETFIIENKNVFLSELNDIISRLMSMGNVTGARDHFFRLDEGKPGDGVCALYDSPDNKLRLYCIRYGSVLLIIGGGGPKKVKKLQQDTKLKSENYFLRALSEKITERIINHEISFVNDGFDFSGNLEFDEEEL